MKKSIIFIISIVAVLFLIGLGFVVSLNFDKLSASINKQNKNEVISDDDSNNNNNSKENSDNRKNTNNNYKNKEDIKTIALLGIDTRSNQYDNSRSDCIIIANVNNKTKEIKIASIYRDCYAYIENYGYEKITHAYAYGGPELALKTINGYLDLNITDYVVVNFDALVDIIDAIGGVELDITSDEVKYINAYLKSSDSSNNIKKEGKQQLNGTQTLAYSRIRYTSGGDYARTDRMRNVIVAGFNKSKQLNVAELTKLATTLFPKVKTNINLTEILNYAPYAKSYSIVKNIGWPYETKFYNNNASYVIPVNLEENVITLHKEFFNEENYQPSETIKKYSKEIEENTK